MSDRLAALRLILGELGISPKIDTVEDRLVIQKAVYLAQLKVSLGYSYGWYLKGPYSPGLTQDYYQLSTEDSDDDSGKVLKDTVKSALQETKDLIQLKPADASNSQWLELLASLHYLKKQSHFNDERTRQKLMETKPHLTHLIDKGVAALQL